MTQKNKIPKLRQWLETEAATDGYRYQIPNEDFIELRDYCRFIEAQLDVYSRLILEQETCIVELKEQIRSKP